MYLDPDYRGQGLGRRLYQQLIPEVRGLGYRSLFAGIALPNPASVGLHEALGFQPVGVFRDVGYKHGAWRGRGLVAAFAGGAGFAGGPGFAGGSGFAGDPVSLGEPGPGPREPLSWSPPA